MDTLHWICSPGDVLRGGLLLGLFFAGAAGSLVHCGPMCGVFVLGQMSDRMARLGPERMCERQRIGNGLLLPYHLGRLTTYAGIGAIAAAFGQIAWFGNLSAALLVIAASLFLIQALGRPLDTPRGWGKLLGRITNRIPRASTAGEYLLGVTLGFLPCGLLYAAVTTAAATADPAMGAAAMLAFGTGTAPILMMIGIAGRHSSRKLQVLAPALMVMNAILLLALAWQRIA